MAILPFPPRTQLQELNRPLRVVRIRPLKVFKRTLFISSLRYSDNTETPALHLEVHRGDIDVGVQMVDTAPSVSVNVIAREGDVFLRLKNPPFLYTSHPRMRVHSLNRSVHVHIPRCFRGTIMFVSPECYVSDEVQKNCEHPDRAEVWITVGEGHLDDHLTMEALRGSVRVCYEDGECELWNLKGGRRRRVLRRCKFMENKKK